MQYSPYNEYGYQDLSRRGLGLPLPPEPPKSQADCPSGTKFKFREETDGYGNSKQIPYCGEPESQLDCPDGTIFVQGRSSDGMKMVYTPSQCLPKDYCEKQAESIALFCSTKGKSIMEQTGQVHPSCVQTKEEYIKSCKEKYGIKNTFPDAVKPIVDAIKPKTEEEEYRNFIFLAMAAVGVYLILSE